MQKKSEIQALSKEGIDYTMSAPSLTNTTNLNLPLTEYHIKASMNSAYDGSAMSIETLNSVITSGCRFLNFQVFSVDNIPVVAHSDQIGGGSFESVNTLLLNDVLKTVSTSVFSKAPNPEDPLFLFFQFKTTNPIVFPLIEKTIKMNFTGSFYNSQFTKNTILSKLKQKIVIIIDNTYYLSLNSLPESLKAFKETVLPYVSVICGTTYFPLLTYTSLLNRAYVTPQINDIGTKTDITTLQISIPDGLNPSNPDIIPFIKDHGVQIVPYRFYIKDDGLTGYETFFVENGSVAFVSMATALLHINT